MTQEHVTARVPTEYHVCAADDVAERDRVLIDAGGVEIGIFKVKGKFYAYENRCVHQGGPVCRGDVLGRWEEHLDEGGQVVGADFSTEHIDIACPWHGWEYDVETGKNIADPRFRLRSFDVVVRDGDIFITIP
ncbi:MAG: Rieske 2Fe-2S domain-containing protein [Streptosporangiales bacterium]|nr:Rieske 2Fe-2S domain-containing protein [Streptosporangiales bacterium]